MSDDYPEYDQWDGPLTGGRVVDPYRTGVRHGVMYAILLGLASVGVWALLSRCGR